jgi:lysyl endopeptidase
MRFRKIVASLALLTFALPALASQLVPDLRQLDAVPLHALPLVKVQKAVSAAQAKGLPLQFAVKMPLPLTLDDGAWQTVDAQTASWRTRVYSANAQTLNFHFKQFRMPEGGALWLYDASGKALAGPYTHSNENSAGELWTAVVPGETAVIEARLPSAAKNQFQLQLAEANHGYRSFGKAGTGSFGSAGACETDVICPAGQPWLNEARALARISINGNTLCSGQLINNVRQDNTPFFLTANHCGISNDVIANSVVFYWNYQNSVCGGNGTEPTFQTQSGATYVASDSGSDFALIKAAQPPSDTFNLYLPGWDAAAEVPQSGGVVHHPMGDVSKISIYSQPASRQTVQLCNGVIPVGPVCLGQTTTIMAWELSYSQGITEPGSSGSALYNQAHQIVGQLSGGSTDCANPGKTDVYGRMEVAWTANSAASGQLKANLDPDNTGALHLGGKNLSGGAVTPPASSGGSGGGGGGALPLLTLSGLLLLAGLRRRR